MTTTLLAERTRALRGRLRSALWPVRYRMGRARRQLLAAIFGRRAMRLVRSLIAQHPTAETSEVYGLISTLATAYGAEWELAERLRALADQAKEDGRWHPNDPMSIEDRTKRAEAELRSWMEEHPGDDPRDDSIIDEIADSWVPAYNHDRLRVALESSLWLIAGDVEGEADSVAELLGIAMSEWIRDALHELVAATFTEEDAAEPHVR